MRLSRSVCTEVDVDVDYELEIDDVIEFIEEASIDELNRLKEELGFPEEKKLTLFEQYYQEMIEKLVKSGISPFEVERKLLEIGILNE